MRLHVHVGLVEAFGLYTSMLVSYRELAGRTDLRCVRAQVPHAVERRNLFSCSDVAISRTSTCQNRRRCEPVSGYDRAAPAGAAFLVPVSNKRRRDSHVCGTVHVTHDLTGTQAYSHAIRIGALQKNMLRWHTYYYLLWPAL
jgi:hypothetical protein